MTPLLSNFNKQLENSPPLIPHKLLTNLKILYKADSPPSPVRIRTALKQS